MTSSATSAPISIPTGLRASTGQIVLDTSYTTSSGIVTTAAQWGGGLNGLPNRFPDFVVFSKVIDTVPDSWGGQVQYNGGATGTIRIFGTAAATDDVGVTEEATETLPAITVTYLALWVTPDPAGINTVVA